MTMPSQAQSSHAPLASLAAHWHACRGDIPPPLVGASVTLVDNADPSKARLYLFGGRLVTTRRMVNDLYELDLLTLRWTKLSVDSVDLNSTATHAGPRPRYFHSCNLWQNKLIIFGGMGYVEGNEAELCVLDEVLAYDLTQNMWDFGFMASASTVSSATQASSAETAPQPRYAHLASASADFLVVIGGQDMANRYVEEINVLDLQQRRWIARQPYEKQRGSYRSLAVEPQWKVMEGDEVSEDEASPNQLNQRRTKVAPSSAPSSVHPLLSPNSISMLPMSRRDWDESGRLKPLPVYVYTNYSFTDVKREMEMVQIETGAGDSGDGGNSAPVPSLATGCRVHVDDRSHVMAGISLPPGLRFPMGAILGQHLIISGTYLANTSQTFAIWALHLRSMTWSRLDVGPLLATGSWNRGVLWPLQSRLIVFGHRERDLVADYNHRQTNWDHVLVIDLEAWGVTQPPVQQMSLAAIRLGLQKLASSTMGSFGASLESGIGRLDEETGDPLLSLGGRGDFEIVCSDGMRLGCDRIILEKRWPWFGARMREYQRQVKMVARTGSSPIKRGSRPSTGEQLSALLEEDERGPPQQAASTGSMRTDPRITPRNLHISEPSPVMLALLIFLYTRCICTKMQRHPAIVAALLIVSKVYDMRDLELWAKHAAHVVMSHELAPPSGTVESVSHRNSSTVVSSGAGSLPALERHRYAVAIYEAATLANYESLQIRALRTVMSIAKWVQRSSISSGKSPATVDSASAERGISPSTPTTSTAAPPATLQRHNSQSQHPTARAASLADIDTLGRRAPSITSPSLSRQGSFGPSGMSDTTEGGGGGASTSTAQRRSGRSDRIPIVMDGTAGGEVDSTGTPPALFTQSAMHAGPWAAPTPPSQLQARRPSAPNSLVVTTTSAPPAPPSTMPASSNQTGRKRFSIFGRSAGEQSKLSNSATIATPTSLGSAKSLVEHQDDRVGRTSVENAPASPFARLSRTNTSGSAGEDSARSTNSVQGTSGLSGQALLGTLNSGVGSGRAPSPSTNVPRVSQANDGGTAAAAARKGGMMNRLKSSSISAGSKSASANENATATATVSTSSIAPSSTNGGNGGGEAAADHIGNGQLSQKDIKALQGIFA